MWLVKKEFNGLNNVIDRDIVDVFSSIFHDNIIDTQHHSPAIELHEDDNSMRLAVALPGYEKKDISIEYEDGYVILNAEKKTESKDNAKPVYSELGYSSLARKVYVGDVDFNLATATLKQGLLSIELPKIEKKKALKLEIK